MKTLPALIAALLVTLSAVAGSAVAGSAAASSPSAPNGTDAAVGDLADSAGFIAATRAGFWVVENGERASEYFHYGATNSIEHRTKASNLRKAKLHARLARAGFIVTMVSGLLAVERMLHAGWAIYAVGAEPLCGKEAVCESPSALRKILVSRHPAQGDAGREAVGAR